jgi:hypothetical protein
MGGFGSGDWRRNRKDHVEECPRIDVRHWHREGLLRRGRCFTWRLNKAGAQGYSINVAASYDKVTIKNQDERARLHQLDEYTVYIDWTRCNYGGRRPWLLCPSPRCGKRVAILYAGAAGFECRHCSRLAYASQYENPALRALRHAKKIRARLGTDLTLWDPLPDKPERMHWRTYFRLLLASQQAKRNARDAFASIGTRWHTKVERMRSFL